MDLTTYSTGIQHIGIPTNDIETTIAFYHKLGFETAFETVNEEANERVAFLKLGTLVIEIYDYINENGLNTTSDTIHFLPFWENGVRFFTIEGPNKEKVEFSQFL